MKEKKKARQTQTEVGYAYYLYDIKRTSQWAPS